MYKIYLVVNDEQGYFRLLKRDLKGRYSIIVDKFKATNKDEAKRTFENKHTIVLH